MRRRRGPLPTLEFQRERYRIGKVGRIGGRKLVIHEAGGYKATRTFQERNGPCRDRPFLSVAQLALGFAVDPARRRALASPPRPRREQRRPFRLGRGACDELSWRIGAWLREQLPQQSFRGSPKHDPIQAAANCRVDNRASIGSILRSVDIPTGARISASGEVIDDMLAHVAQVANVPRGETVDFSKINRGAKPEGQYPVSEFERFVRGHGEEVAFGMKGMHGLTTLHRRAGRGQNGHLMFLRRWHAYRLRHDSLRPLNQPLEGHEALLVGRHYRGFDLW